MPVVHSSAQRLENRRRIDRPRDVIEGQHFVVAQEVELLEVLEAKPGPPVVSISTVRATPSALGLVQAARAGAVQRQEPLPARRPPAVLRRRELAAGAGTALEQQRLAERLRQRVAGGVCAGRA